MEKEFKPGVYDISIDEYHASNGLSRSKLWAFKQLPYKYWYQYLSGEYKKPEDKEALILGNAMHTLILEANKFDEEYFIMPKINKRTKDGKALEAAKIEEAGNRVIIKEDLYLLAQSMADSILEKDLSLELLENAKCEKSIYWIDKDTGLLCKARPDAWNHPLMMDIKSTVSASYRSFQRSALDYGYFLQAAMLYEASLSLGLPFEKFVFICVEKTAPFSVGYYTLDDEALAFGRSMFRGILDKYKYCLDNNEWPEYGVQSLMVPRYATEEIGNE